MIGAKKYIKRRKKSQNGNLNPWLNIFDYYS